jgi:prepilin-type processing-associated H-X9-DG protein
MSSHARSRSADRLGQKNATPRESAFTFVELIAVVAGIALLACAAVPALARSKTRTPAAGCLSNLHQLQTGAAAYADDNNGILMPNAPLGASATTWCGGGNEDWLYSSWNIRADWYRTNLMGLYLGGNVNCYRCPGDVVPSGNGFRVRSYSMNSQVGSSLNYNNGWRTYTKESDIVSPSPANLFVFCDEHPGSINDGYLQVSFSTSEIFPDVPASYLENGCGFSFADGHAEIHKWQGTTLLIPVVRNVRFGNIRAPYPNDPDWMWLTNRSSSSTP